MGDRNCSISVAHHKSGEKRSKGSKFLCWKVFCYCKAKENQSRDDLAFVARDIIRVLLTVKKTKSADTKISISKENWRISNFKVETDLQFYTVVYCTMYNVHVQDVWYKTYISSIEEFVIKESLKFLD